MTTDVQVGSGIIGNVETTIATLPAWHPRVDVYVNPNNDPLAIGTKWRVYALTGGIAALLAEGQFTGSVLTEGERVIAGLAGGGTTIQLRAVTDGRPTTAAIGGAIVGYDPAEAIAAVAEEETASHALVSANTTFGTLLEWFPNVEVVVDASADPTAVGSFWQLCATIPTFPATVIAGQVLTSIKQAVFRDVIAGAQTFFVRARTPNANTLAITASILGYTGPAGGGGGGGGGIVYLVAATSAALVAGDWVAPVPSSILKITKAVPAAVTAAQSVLGCVSAAYAPGAPATVSTVGGPVVGAGVFGDLGPGVASPLKLLSTARAARSSKPIDGNVLLGTTDATGNVTVNPAVPINTTKKIVYNAVTFGCVPDGDRLLATGTDNYAAIQAMLDAVSAQSNASGLNQSRIHFPPGVYRVSQTPRLSKVAHISGDTGGFCNNGTSVWIMGDVGVCSFQCDSFGNSVDGFDSSGSTIEHMGFCGPIGTGSKPFDRLTVGGAVGLGAQCVPSMHQRGYINVTYECTVAGNLGTTVTPNGTTISSEPTWPGWWQQNQNDPVTYGYADGYFPNGSTILVENLEAAAMPYLYTAGGGTRTSPGNPPDARNLPAFIAAHAYLDKTDIIPTVGKWTGYRYQTVGAFTSGVEPVAWGTVVGGDTTDGAGNHYTNEGPIWGRVIGQTTPEDTGGTILWTLTATVPTFVSGGVTFQPRFGVPALRASSAIHVADCAIDNARGQGYDIAASGANGALGGTNANGFTIDRVTISNVGGHGVRTRGADVNAGHGESVGVLNCGGAAISEQSFLGNTWQSCQAAVTTAAPFQSLGPTNKSLWLGNYQEGGEAGSRIKYGTWFGGTGTAGFSYDSNGILLDRGGNNALAVTLTKRVYVWGCDKTTNLTFQYNGPSESLAINVDPRTVSLDLNDLLRPSGNGNGYIYQVSACDAGTSGILGAAEPVWPTTIGATVHNGTLTFACIGRSGLTVALGVQPNFATPSIDIALQWQGSDETQVNTFQANCGDIGWYGFTNNTVPGNASLRLPGQNAKDLQGNGAIGMVDIYNRVCFGRGNAVGREFTFQAGFAVPATVSKEVGRLNFFGSTNTAAAGANYIGAVLVTSAGGGDTWWFTGKTVQVVAGVETQENFRALRLNIGGQTKTISAVVTNYPKIATDLDVTVTTDATVTSLHVLDAVPTHKYVDICVKVIAETVDAGNVPDGTAQASWLLRASCKEAAGALTAIKAVQVIYGQPTDALNNAGGNSANWLATIDLATSTTPRVRVTGVAATRIAWRCIVEPLQ